MSEFTHFLLTRFNVKANYGGGVAPDSDWLLHRFDLFERFCYPSVKSQTISQFIWFVFFDVDTPPEFREKITAFAQWPNFRPCFVESAATMGLETLIQIRHNVDPGAKYLITTRMDNDDAISVDFIEQVQRRFAEQESQFINFPNGFVFSNNRLYRKTHDSNQFISLIERLDGFKTVWCGQHQDLASAGPVQQVKTDPVWMQVVHGRNVANRVGSWPRTPLSKMEGRFVINQAYDPSSESLLLIRLENVRRSLLRMLPFALNNPLVRLAIAVRKRLRGRR